MTAPEADTVLELRVLPGLVGFALHGPTPVQEGIAKAMETVRRTEVRLGPSAEPDAQAIFRVQLAGRMCYGQIEVRWR